MIGWPAGVRIWLVAGITDMRKGMDTLCALVQTALVDHPFSGQIFIFRGRRGDKVKVLWHAPDGLSLYCKRLDRGHFVLLTSAQLSMLLDNGARLLLAVTRDIPMLERYFSQPTALAYLRGAEFPRLKTSRFPELGTT